MSGAHISGGQNNCAVTFALVSAAFRYQTAPADCLLISLFSVAQGLVNLVSQLVGSVLGATLLLAATAGGEGARDRTHTLGSYVLSHTYSVGNAFVSELLRTALLVYVVFETAVNNKSTARHNAPLAIGGAVFLAHMVNISITGCSINPTRSFGPAMVASLNGAEGLW